MREIKFKAWNAHGKVMHSWEELVEKNKIHLLASQKPSYLIMQYTGLKDKNGVEIYEGDIVKAFSVFDMTYDYSFEKDNDPKTLYQISFDDGCFQFKGVKQWNDGSNDWRSIENVELSKVEVVGNIYENPELFNNDDT